MSSGGQGQQIHPESRQDPPQPVHRQPHHVEIVALNAGHRHTLEKCLEEFDHATLHFIDVTQYDESIKGFKAKAHYSKEIFYKLLAANLLPQYDRIICSDVDVVFTGDFSPVYFMFPEGDFYYAGVGPVENNRMPYYEPHFSPREMSILEHEISAGFMLINLKKIREDQKSEETLDFYVKNYQRFLFPEAAPAKLHPIKRNLLFLRSAITFPLFVSFSFLVF